MACVKGKKMFTKLGFYMCFKLAHVLIIIEISNMLSRVDIKWMSEKQV